MRRGLDTLREHLSAAHTTVVHPAGARQNVSEEDAHVNEYV